MRQLFVAAAIVSLAATGCVSSTQLARNNNGAAAQHVARNQATNNSGIVLASHHEGMLGGMFGKKKNSCDPCCGECSECECGCAEDCCACDTCCDSTCGCSDECCESCCDPCCGCEDPCCGGSCENRNFCQKLIDRIASGGCKDGCNSGCNGSAERGLGYCKGGKGSGACMNCGGTGGHCGCGPCCATCAAHECCLCPHAGGYPAMTRFNPGPPVGQTAYPYYTTRGPRDFLVNNPPTIGPY